MGWGVFTIKPNMQNAALENLSAQAFEAFVPMLRELITRGGRKVEKLSSLFPRYGFVKIEERWRAINSTRGVAALFSAGERPVVLTGKDAALIDNLHALQLKRGWVESEEFESMRKIGDEIEVVGGPFYGFKGTFAGSTNSEKLAVLLNMLGRAVRVELSPEHIR